VATFDEALPKGVAAGGRATASRTRSGARGAGPAAVAEGVERAWPRTTRILPWLLAAFLVMLWLVPFDSITAPFSVGVDSKLDRVVLVLIVGIWVVLAAAGGRHGPRFRRSPLNLAILALVVIAMASIATQLGILTNLGALKLSIKQLALLLSYFTFFFFVVTVARPQEVRNLLRLMLALACLTALGTIYEYRFHTNLFFSLSASVFKGFTIAPPAAAMPFARPPIVGPTQAPLADATILAIALSFALVFLFHAKRRRDQLLWYIACALLLAGALATGRKSSVLIPVAALIALLLHAPRRAVRFLPALLLLVALVRVIAPHAISSLLYQFETVSTSTSTAHRTEAYPAITPLILSHPFLGIGYGSYDPHKYWILDNQYLDWLVQTGFLGLAAFILLLVTGAAVAYRAARSKDPTREVLGLALVGAIAGFAVACATFDVFAFPQAPYLLMFVLALAVVAAAERERTITPAVGEGGDMPLLCAERSEP